MEQTAFLEEMRHRLLSEQAILEGELGRLHQITGTDDSFSEHAGLGNHMADDATQLFEQEKNLAIQQHTIRLLNKVETALRKLDAGTYGFCDSCRVPIDHARLETLPYAALCVRCKARQEQEKA